MVSEVIKGSNNKLSFSNLAGASTDGLPLGTIVAYHGTVAPTGFLIADGSTYDTDKYNALYLLLGSNKLPDLREANLVGVGTNGTNTISVHDVYTLGQFKDDQYQQHGICDISVTNASGVKVHLNSSQIDQDGCTYCSSCCVSAEDQQAFVAKMDEWVKARGLGDCWTGCLYMNTNSVSSASFSSACLRAGTANMYCHYGSGTNGFADVLNYDNWTVGIGSTSPTASSSVYVRSGIETPKLEVTIGCDSCGTPRCGATTHGKQYGVNYIIKAIPGLVSADESELYSQIVSYIDNHAWGIVSCNCNTMRVPFTYCNTNCLMTPTNANICYNCSSVGSCLSAYAGGSFYNNACVTLVCCYGSTGNTMAASISAGSVGGYMCYASTCVGSFNAPDIVTNCPVTNPLIRNYVTSGVGGFNMCCSCTDFRADGLYYKYGHYYCDSSLGCFVTDTKLWKLDPECGWMCYDYSQAVWCGTNADWCGCTCTCTTNDYHLQITNTNCGNTNTMCRIAIGSCISCTSNCSVPAIAIGSGIGLKNCSVIIGTGACPNCCTFSQSNTTHGMCSVLIGAGLGSCICNYSVAIGYGAGAAMSTRCCFCGCGATSIGYNANALTPGGVAVGYAADTMGFCDGGVAIGRGALSIALCDYTMSVINTVYDSDPFSHMPVQHGVMFVNIKPYARQCEIWNMVCRMIVIANGLGSSIKIGMPLYYSSRWSCPLNCQIYNQPTLRFGMQGAFSTIQSNTTYIQTGQSYVGNGACPVSVTSWTGGLGTSNSNYCSNTNALCMLIDCCHCAMSFAGVTANYGCTGVWSTCSWNGIVYF